MRIYNIHKASQSETKKNHLANLTMVFSLLLLFSFLQTGPALAEDPMEPIEKTVDEILVILQSDREVEWPKKRQRISKIIQKRFDFQEQSRLVLASHWEKITPEEKEQFISLFSDLQEYGFLNRLKNYSDEKVTFTKQLTKGNKAVVYSTIITATEEIPIIYRMKNNQDSWFVYDVIIDGVSIVKNYRQQFSVIMEKEKFPGLIAKMEEKIEQIKTEEKGDK